MQVLQNTALWITVPICLCLVALWRRWRKAHPRCPCCHKPIRRAFAHCPWCGLPQVRLSPLPKVRPVPRLSRRQREALIAQEAARLPHHRRRTVVLPQRGRKQTAQRYHSGTVLVPEPFVSSHVPICAQCRTVLDPEDTRCWFCESTMLIWQEKPRR